VQFEHVAGAFDQVEETSSRNRMVEILADVFRDVAPDEVDKLVYLAQGQLKPPYERTEFGVGEALVRDAVATAAGVNAAEVRRRFTEVGDYGTVARALLSGKAAAEAGVLDVYADLNAIAEAGGKGAVAEKKERLVALLTSAGPLSAKHIVRIVLGRLRLGIGDPTVMDGLSFSKTGSKADRKVLERAYNICSDLGLVARAYLEGGVEALDHIRVQAGRPVRPALCERLSTPEAIVEKLGRCAEEPKIDGFRCQVHAWGGQTRAFSRNLEDMSPMFPEIVEAVGHQAPGREVIVEGEAVAYDPDTAEFVPFQVTVQRRRKYDIDEMRRRLPLKLLAFDVLYLDGQDLTPLPYVERRQTLLDLFGSPIDYAAPSAAGEGPVIRPNEARELDSAEELAVYFAGTVERGQEGIVAKRLDSPYQAGARNFNWIKLKRSYQGELRDTVDCAVVGYWRGKGNRAKLGIGTLLTAVYDQERDLFTTVTRLGSGFSEDEWVRLRVLLDATASAEKPARVDSLLVPDVWCVPAYVVETQADEITQSPMHTTGRAPDGHLGYALRFPRAVGFVRADRTPEDATTAGEIAGLYRRQGQKKVEE
jgi:DNA ligase-1